MATWRARKRGSGTRDVKPRRGLPTNPANDRSRVGVRELRQNLSVYLDRVKDGETLTVTEHRAVVAVLAPPRPTSVLERMIVEGRATAPRHAIRDLPAPRPATTKGLSSHQVLAELRDDRLP